LPAPPRKSFNDRLRSVLRRGPNAPPPAPTGEQYDLILLSAGITGLAAAPFYRPHPRSNRILLLDNHDDFGGHAERNEFDLGNRPNLMSGAHWRSTTRGPAVRSRPRSRMSYQASLRNVARGSGSVAPRGVPPRRSSTLEYTNVALRNW
jgi:hypothetical protein